MKRILLALLSSGLLISACGTQKTTATEVKETGNLNELVGFMTGMFSSEAQSNSDKDFYHISLVMYPIWEEDSTAKWLYVEQAVASMMKKPYRQRVYRVSATDTPGQYESAVFTLEESSKFIHGWQEPSIFQDITPDDLSVREGCSIFLTYENGAYNGSTHEKDCISDFRGATYATSIVSVTNKGVVSWDQGWNNEDEQVWGAVKSGYIFDKINSFSEELIQ